MFFEDRHFLSADAGVRHGFFGRQGGGGTGPYASLNVHPAAGDDSAAVQENRARIAAALGTSPDNLLTAAQCHRAVCIAVDTPWPLTEAPAADALVTDRTGLLLGVMTADCAPVLLCGATPAGRPVIGAAHAGWQGALAGVLEATIAAMTALGAEKNHIRAAIGPCIQQASYTVDPAFMNRFTAHDPENEFFFKTGREAGRFLFDLPGYAARRLAAAGVRQVSLSGRDTCAEEQDYFSFRRTTLRGAAAYGRQFSGIMICPPSL